MVARSATSRRLRIAAVAGGVWAVVVLVAFACGPGDLSDLTRGRLDASQANVDRCPNRAEPPDPPDSGDQPSLPGSLIFAVNNMRVDTGEYEAGLPKPLSIDLDHACACVEPPSCIAPPDAGAPVCKPNPDGRDNVAGPLLGDLAQLITGLRPTFLQDRIHGGIFSMIFSLEEWNGTDNDPHVLLMVRMSPGLNSRLAEAGITAPNFDGNDIWDIDPGSIVGGQQLLGKDCNTTSCIGTALATSAYVSGGTLVATFSAIPLVIVSTSGALTLPFVGATITAQLTKVGSSYNLQGELAGRMPATDLLKATTSLVNPITNTSLCSDKATYALYRSQLCSVLDLAADPGNDKKPGTRCGAVSEAVGFAASPAKVGIVRGITQDAGGCGSEIIDSCP